MSHNLLELPSPDVAEHLKRSPLAVIPFGSVEQHGPHLPAGTDIYAAELVTAALAERLDALYAPCGPYGVTPIHAGTPGTVSLRPETFEALVSELCAELIRMGARELVFVNWHEMNGPSLDRVATDVQDRHGAFVVVAHACYVAQRIYAAAGGELNHGGGIETLAVLAQSPDLVRFERAAAAQRPAGAAELDKMRRSSEVYGFVTDIREFGGDGWHGDPGWARGQDAGAFADTVAEDIARQVRDVLAIRRRPTERAAGTDS